MMKRLVWVWMLTAGLLAAQDTGAASESARPEMPGDTPIRVIQLKNASATNVADNLAYIMRGQAIISSSGSSVIIRAPENVIGVIEQAVQQLDIASNQPSNVELTVQLLYGSAGDGLGDPIPSDLESTVAQLRSIFPFANYSLLDTVLLRGRDRQSARSSGMLSLEAPAGIDRVQQYDFRTDLEVISGDAPRIVRLRGLQTHLDLWLDNGPGQSTRHVEGYIETDLDVVEGRKTVVGKSNVSADDAIILVVTPRVVE